MSILVDAAVFAEAIKILGGITIIGNTLAAVKSVPIITMALMLMITFFADVFLGSGNAPQHASDPLVSDMTARMGVFTATIALPIRLSSDIGRCMPPVAGVVIVIPGMIELDTMDTVRRCSTSVAVTCICSPVVSHSVV